MVPTLLWANLRLPSIWVALTGLVSFGAVGLLDDYLKIRRKHNQGLTVAQKFTLEIIAALLVGVLLLAMNARRLYDTSLNVPFVKKFQARIC